MFCPKCKKELRLIGNMPAMGNIYFCDDCYAEITINFTPKIKWSDIYEEND